VRNPISTVGTLVVLFIISSSLEKGKEWGGCGRTETGYAFTPEGLEAHFVGCVAQIVVFVWDAPYERRLERRAPFNYLLYLSRRE
jgi:hypothetical protein